MTNPEEPEHTTVEIKIPVLGMVKSSPHPFLEGAGSTGTLTIDVRLHGYYETVGDAVEKALEEIGAMLEARLYG